ncbi:MAG: bifunctional 3,4-dihydroxy-2-butanone-4-phosphate synthase/GTP cyclohydrolase II, partial [Candidatus Competibacteraceae bacterium]|nr:bifunctional 3,4-dihydroxy-2-butanone-4-phosphate synthase/GTP cyclohydrolase II [Candidatus Competibacteraceae bacterium]
EHGLKVGTIADLIRYRIENEQTVEREAECPLTTEFGDFRLLTYQDTVERRLHFALVKGKIIAQQPTLVRVHVQNILCDLLGARLSGCGWPLRDALARVAGEGGVVVVLGREPEPAALVRRLRLYQFQEQGGELAPTPGAADSATELRTYGIGAQILLDVGVRRMRVLSAPKRMSGLAGFNLEVVEYVS